MRIVRDTHIDFMSKTFIAGCLSALLIIIGAASLIINGGPKLSIDFKGGTMVAVNFTEPVDINKIRSALAEVSIDGQNFDFSTEEIKHFGDETNVAIRIASLDNEPPRFANRVAEKLATVYPELLPEERTDFILSIDKVGPKVGAELSGDAILAMLYALGFILVYISIRFEFKYAVGAIAALTHDVLITLGVFSVLGYEISLAVIAAFLTIVGYSLNDTIVIFDRVRENVKALKGASMESVINQSINESLSRTIITSLTTFLVVLILFLVGGEVIHTFSFAMIVGVIIGTYSSIFVASPVVIKMDKTS
ncbi:MAG: protein translocase subunit SecF [Candidatus Marinimicrobia bacterium]|jgi:preprotein translocase SecF subunit|nr:protein translocase subunit SecF [Candidatus Neomarinimicrobiota bacterium]|tara:strand:+ start:4464 stop:5387 length:924 start_codon:yes stop_codon:yes gene_type:complete